MSVRGEVGISSCGLVGWVFRLLAADSEPQLSDSVARPASADQRLGPTVGGATAILLLLSDQFQFCTLLLRHEPLLTRWIPSDIREMAQTSGKPVIVQWIVDTRKLWPSAEKTAQLETTVCEPFRSSIKYS